MIPDQPMINMVGFLRMQDDLQIAMRAANPTQGGSPYLMSQDELVEFIRWNTLALTDELHEMLGEVGWKPWASSNHINYPASMFEMVDAWHFFLNILNAIAAANNITLHELAVEFENYYQEKNKKNLQRQVDGYDGVSTKCPICKRELSETPDYLHCHDTAGVKYCTTGCYAEGAKMSQHDPDRVAKIQGEIEAQSAALPPTETAQSVTERIAAEHVARQQAQGYQPDPAKSIAQETIDELPQVQQIIKFPDVEGGEYSGKAGEILKKCQASGEPIFIFRAKDIFTIQVLVHYLDIIEKFGPSSYELQQEIGDQIQVFKDWQAANSDKVRFPD